MRRIVLALVLAFCVRTGAFSAPAVVQHTSSIGNTGASATLTLSSPVSFGDLLVATTTGTTTAYPSSLADSAGVTFTERGNYGTTANATALWDYNAARLSTLTISSGISGLEGVAVDSSGNIYASNYSNSTITKYASSGGSPTLTISSGISYPRGVAVDSSGNIYASNYGNSAITKYADQMNYTCSGAATTCLDFGLIEVSGAQFSVAGAGYTTAQTTSGSQGSLMVCALGQPAVSTATGITISNATGQTAVVTDAESATGAGIFSAYAFNSGSSSSCSASNSGNANIVLANYANGGHGLLLRGVGYDFTQPRARFWDSRLQDLYTMGFEPDWQQAA